MDTAMQKEYTHIDVYISEDEVIELPRKDVEVYKEKKESKVAKYAGFAIAFLFVFTVIFGLIYSKSDKK